MLTLLGAWANPVQAQVADPADRFDSSAAIADEFAPATTPLSNSTATVVLKLSGDPVAVVRASRPGKTLNPGEKETIEQNLKSQQDALAPQIAAQGATVLAQFQDAINGIKVEAPRSQIPALAALPGVIAVKPVGIIEQDNATSVPFIGAPAVWGLVPGIHGEGVRVAIIDTGLDFTHANFGGPGTVAAYQAAHAASTVTADPTLFGPNAPKVKGGIDLVGDDYDAGSSDPARRIPHPDSNPLDCGGHGSHVGGTVAGLGVLPDGSTYTGPYDSTTSSKAFRIGPGVAPRADLYAIRVFGCNGSTNVTVDAINWAVEHDMQVINMSLGSSFGTADDASAEASQNAADSGVIVVASAGNNGTVRYITGSPAAATKAISVAAIDSTASFPGATLSLSTGASVTALDANGVAVPSASLPVYVLRTATGAVSLGCNEAEYVDSQIAGKLVVALRGSCARVDRAVFGARHGAAAVAMLNTDSGYPVYEGAIPGVGIPFLGIRGGADSNRLVAAAGGSASLSAARVPNPTFRAFAGFSSAGPRNGDGFLKPDISAPGVATFSTAVGSGNDGSYKSGTSMAAPHVTGVAALAVQAHPDWDSDHVRVAIINTADASQVAGYSVSIGGGGLVQPLAAARTQVIAQSDQDNQTSLSFGVAEFSSDYTATQSINLENLGSTPASFNISVLPGSGSPHTVTLSRPTVTVPAHGEASVSVTLTVTAATVGNANAFREVAGLISFSPTTADGNGGASLALPYYVVPRARSRVQASLDAPLGPSHPSANAVLRNSGSAVSGSADFYAWGLSGSSKNLGSINLRAVGVQSFDSARYGKVLVFAVNTYKRWSTASLNEFDILVDVNGDGKPDYDVVGMDYGLLTSGKFDGRVASAVINLATNRVRILFLATAPTDGSTLLLPVRASDVGLNAGNPRFTYTAQSFEVIGVGEDNIAGRGSFNAWNGAISLGSGVQVAPGTGTVSVPLAINGAEWAITPALGAMSVTLDNYAGASQAQLLSASP